MTGKVVIEVENLSKFYRLGTIGGGTLREDLARWWAKTRGRPDPLLKIGEQDHGNREGEHLWALRDVSFQVREGEVLGVIGRNGAGKSTLLKILSRITAPTSGNALIRGRVGSLLEVGTGFHPELTGRENVFLNGAILGMNRAEIAGKLEEIVEFAEMARYIDTPVKRYSSGMTVRLAFSVAAHLEPEILIVDEVLAVGDVVFQRKCLEKMASISNSGRTIIFVSHNIPMIQQICRSSIVLNKGSVEYSGDTNKALRVYREMSGLGFGELREGTGELELLGVHAKYVSGEYLAVIDFHAVFRSTANTIDFMLDMAIEDEKALRLVQVVPQARSIAPIQFGNGDTFDVRIRIKCGALAPGAYFCVLYAHDGNGRCFLHRERIPIFDVARKKDQMEWGSRMFTPSLCSKYEYEVS